MRRLSAPITALLLALLLAPSAQAAWFPADVIDGPGEIDALGDVDVARDGSGGIVYIKREAGVPQVFLSRLHAGAWEPPERLSSGAAVTEAAVTATDGGRLAAAWVAGGEVWGTVIPAAKQAQAPAPPVILGSGGASGVAIDMGINEDGYAVWSAAGDVHAARLDGTAWTPLAGALDLDPARTAGTGAQRRPRVAVSAEGNAVATWGETDASGRTHVVSRRLTRLTPSSAPQDLTLDTFGGEAGGSADSPDIDIEDDGSFAWVAFRQDVGGRSRTVARRLRGSLFEDPLALDGGVTSAAPRIDFAGKGIGGAVISAEGNAVFSDYLNKFDLFDPPQRIDATPGDAAPTPAVAASEREDVYVAWRTGAGGGGDVRARRKEKDKAFEPEFVASNPAYGTVPPGALAIGSDRLGNTVVAMIQSPPTSTGQARITASVWDRPPGRPGVIGSAPYRGRRPFIRWAAGSEIWGRQTFTVRIDGKVVGSTTGTELTSSRRFGKGRHTATITATDRRGQAVTSRTYSFRVDPQLPTLRIAVQRKGRRVSVRSSAADRGPSGLRSVTVEWGDGKRSIHRNASHVYKKGRYTLRVTASDRAGNETVKTKALRIP
jgi:PKD domain-containing protein